MFVCACLSLLLFILISVCLQNCLFVKFMFLSSGFMRLNFFVILYLFTNLFIIPIDLSMISSLSNCQAANSVCQYVDWLIYISDSLQEKYLSEPSNWIQRVCKSFRCLLKLQKFVESFLKMPQPFINKKIRDIKKEERTSSLFHREKHWDVKESIPYFINKNITH